MMHGQRNTKL